MKLNDKTRGALFGMALGDALGLGTEFMTAVEVRTHYPGGLHDFSQIIRDAHRAQWKRGDWTNDTEFIIAILQSILERGRIDCMHVAGKFKKLLDSSNVDLLPIYRILKLEADWDRHPREAAARAWRIRNRDEASNEAVHRALPVGLMADSHESLTESAKEITLITHADSRCVCSVTVIAQMVHDLFWHERETTLDELCDLASEVDPRTVPYIEKAYDSRDITELKLDDEDTLWYTRKSMGAALWALWHCSSPAEMLDRVVNAGGDADTNASLALMLGGLKYGYDALPATVTGILQYDRMAGLAEEFSAFMQKEARRRGVETE